MDQSYVMKHQVHDGTDSVNSFPQSALAAQIQKKNIAKMTQFRYVDDIYILMRKNVPVRNELTINIQTMCLVEIHVL